MTRNYWTLGILGIAALVILAAVSCGEASAPSPNKGPAVEGPTSTSQAQPTSDPSLADDMVVNEDGVAAPLVAAYAQRIGQLASPGPQCAQIPDSGGDIDSPGAEPTGIHAWINADPLCLSQLKGNVVLIDFWTYTCVNCIRTFPYLKLWFSRYADDGLVILGVHTPEFEFEEDPDNVLNATQENGITWPVAMDNDYNTWDAYDNRYWPAKYLMDKDGIIRYTHFGEGKYAETEEKIRELLEEAGADLSLEEFPQDQELDPAFLENQSVRPTPELYGGYLRGCHPIYGPSFVFPEEFCSNVDEVTHFRDPGRHEANLIYLNGPWFPGKESLRYAAEEADDPSEGYLALKFSAKSANAVINRAQGGEPYRVLVTLDGEYLTDANKGQDVVIEADGRSVVEINEPRMYRLVEAPQFDTYELKLFPNSPDFALFAFTFGLYKSGI